jgi:hypothetical protein
MRLSLRVLRQANGIHDAINIVTHKYVAPHSRIRVDLSIATGLDHVTVSKLYALGTLSTQFTSVSPTSQPTLADASNGLTETHTVPESHCRTTP